MTRDGIISALIVLAAAALPAAAATAHEPISSAQVAGAISNAGIAISAEQVTLLSDVVATTTDPTLTVESMDRWGDHRMKVRMSCANAACLPFFVAVRWGQTEPTPTALVNHPATIALTASPSPRSVIVRAGSTATLMLEGDHVHIQLLVVCLENGSVGQTIRVATKDNHQTFMARVGVTAVLRGSLQ